MIRRTTRSTRTYTLFPYTTLFRAARDVGRPREGGPRSRADHEPVHQRRDPERRRRPGDGDPRRWAVVRVRVGERAAIGHVARVGTGVDERQRSEEHTSELKSLMRISYAVFCLKKKHKK